MVTKNNYINKAEFLCAMTEFKNENCKLKDSQHGNYIAQCIMDIAYNMGRSSKFRSYTWLPEMIEDGIENCIKYIDRFDPNHAKKNPFGYFGRIIFFAFLRRIKKEKQQQQIKYRILSDSEEVAKLISMNNNNNIDANTQGFIDQLNMMLAENEMMVEVKENVPKVKKAIKPGPLADFI